MRYLDGCGVEYVHWLPPRAINKKECSAYDTPLLAAASVGLSRIHRALVRARIESWESLASVKQEQFREWRNYGEVTHCKLVAIALSSGYVIEPWSFRKQRELSGKDK